MYDSDLVKFPWNVDITLTTLIQNITKKVFLATLLNRLFGSNNVIRIDLKNRFFFDKNSNSITQKIALSKDDINFVWQLLLYLQCPPLTTLLPSFPSSSALQTWIRRLILVVDWQRTEPSLIVVAVSTTERDFNEISLSPMWQSVTLLNCVRLDQPFLSIACRAWIRNGWSRA